MSWIDNMPASERAALVDAGRIGYSRFDGPLDTEQRTGWCAKCQSYQSQTRPLEAGSRYRICATCDSAAVDAATDAYIAAGFDALTPLQQRYEDGDR